MGLELKAVWQILDFDFFIPFYQRGYRWDRRQVEDLLDDIYDFSQKKEKGFYCLQPIVVQPDGANRYRVIDGQQRLTTLYIILKYLEEARRIIFSDDRLFKLEYETRKDSQNFLQNDLSKGVNRQNPDFYYMSKAYQTIKEWFENNKINKADFLNALLKFEEKDGKDRANNVRFIWYELSPNEDEIKVFTRLNIGKIPLSNSELIKALILQGIPQNEQFKIVSEWDYIEKNVQDDRFFAFLTTKKYKNTRIDFIFDLVAKKYKKQYNIHVKEKDERFSFYLFEKLLKEGLIKKEELWDEVKKYFRIFEELYNENSYYHYVGYLVNSKSASLFTIVETFEKENKDQFKKELEKMIRIVIKKPLEDLEYNAHPQEIQKALFLFNVLITLDSGYARYPFDLHIKEQWSLEHIHAKNSEEMPEKYKKELLQEQLRSQYIDDSLKKSIQELLSQDSIDPDAFNTIEQKIYQKFTDEDEEIDTIDNLALLSKADNSSLNSAVFPEKRARIKKRDKEGRFIPLGTKNVFMKYYSDEAGDFLRWNRKDREAYKRVLQEKLGPFIKEKR